MATCSTCNRTISTRQVCVTCCDCNKDYHGSCVKMTKAEYENMNIEGTVWRCEPCGVTRRSSLKFQALANEGTLTLQDVMKAIADLAGEHKKTIAEFNASYELLNIKLDENIAALKDHTSTNARLMEVIETQASEIKSLKEKVNLLEAKLNESEQYSRRNCVEIQGVPAQDGDVIGTVMDVGKALGMDIDERMIDACHTLSQRPDAKGPPTIIVKFVRRLDADTILAKRRDKRQLSTRHLGLPTDNPIYINESLTPARRRLLALAREVRRNKDYKWIWVRGGKIFLRKMDKGPVSIVKCQSDLDKL